MLRHDRDGIFTSAETQAAMRALGIESQSRTPHAHLVEATIKKVRRQFAPILAEETGLSLNDKVKLAVERYNRKPTDNDPRPPADLMHGGAEAHQDHARRLALAQVQRAMAARKTTRGADYTPGQRDRLYNEDKRRANRGWHLTGTITAMRGTRVAQVRVDDTGALRLLHVTWLKALQDQAPQTADGEQRTTAGSRVLTRDTDGHADRLRNYQPYENFTSARVVGQQTWSQRANCKPGPSPAWPPA